MIEYKYESITDADNATADAFNHASSSQRENPNAIFTSKNMEKLDKLFNKINYLTINESRYELNTATVSGAQGDLTINLDTVTHTSNGISDQKLLSCWTIGEVSIFTPQMKPTLRLMPQNLLTPTVKEIFMNATSGNAWTNRTPRRISRTGVDGSIPISTPIHIGMSKYPIPDSSDSTGTRGTGTRITIGTNDTPFGLNVSPSIENIRKFTTPDLRKSN